MPMFSVVFRECSVTDDVLEEQISSVLANKDLTSTSLKEELSFAKNHRTWNLFKSIDEAVIQKL